MKYDALPSELFSGNRMRLSTLMAPQTLAVFNSNDIMPTNADGSMGFRQNSDLYYLTGIDQEETTLVLFPHHPDPKFREVLFIRETNEHIAIWEGHKYTRHEATSCSGIKTVFWTHQFEAVFKQMIARASGIYLNTNEHLRNSSLVETRDARFIKWCSETYPLHQRHRVAPLMHALRSVKSVLEIEAMKKAISITAKGFDRVLKFVKPGVNEYEIEAELIHEFIRNRSNGFAYGPIIASGKNACVLHYTQNNNVCRDGDVLLMDVAAEYANYASDLTRCIPVNGRFNPRQKQVYNAVKRVLLDATKLLVPGNTIEKLHHEVGLMMEKELADLGLLTLEEIKNQDPERPAYKKYFMHGTSHFLGLDVHDVGDFSAPLAAGMVFTCEPGIYIPEEGLGIRLENDILITNQGPVNLMESIPLEPEEIESLMNV